MKKQHAKKHWSLLCKVEIAPLLAWLRGGGQSWSTPAGPDKPRRVFRTPEGPTRPIVEAVLEKLPGRSVVHGMMLSGMPAGASHGLHVDVVRADWLTRVHVPLITSPGAWMLFEDEGERVHFEAGRAYTFDVRERHAFGNDGGEARVHLIFDVLEA